jgi:uncharacterized protein
VKRTLTKQDAIDLWQGTKILGCGGGGSPEEGMEAIHQTYGKGLSFQLAQADDLPDDTLVVTVGFVGGGITAAEQEQVSPFQRTGDAVLRAIEALENCLGKRIGAYMPCEPGAGNSFVPFRAAALKGVVTVDLDTAGRAKPEVVNSTTSIFNVSLTPLAIASDFGDVLLMTEAVDERRVEMISRYIARASGGMCAVARCPITIGEARGKLISGTMGRCLAAGRAIRDSSDPVSTLARALSATSIFEGTIQARTREEHGGFMWGEIHLSGRKSFHGHTYRVYYKNENLIGWLDGDLNATTPDLMALVDAQTGEGVYNWMDEDLRVGRDVVLLHAPADPLWLSQRGLELFGPRHFGFDLDYHPWAGT